MDETLQLAFVGRGDGNHGPPVAYRDDSLGIHHARALGPGKYLLEPLGGLPLPFADSPPHPQQFRRSVVAHLPEPIEDGIDGPHDLRQRLDPQAPFPQKGVESFAPAEDEERDGARRCERPPQRNDLLHIEERPLDTDFGRDAVQIDEVVVGEALLHPEDAAHLVGQPETPFDLRALRAKRLRREQLPCAPHRAARRDLFAKAVETDLLLEIRRIDHRFSGSGCASESHARRTSAAWRASSALRASSRSRSLRALRSPPPISEKWT